VGRAYTPRRTAHLKALEQKINKTNNTHKRIKWQEIIKLRAEVNHVETKRPIQRFNKTRRWFFKKINKIDKLSARLTRVLKLIKYEMKRET
jgi:penicillin-binding protein-related factor A (putative recombinase)